MATAQYRPVARAAGLVFLMASGMAPAQEESSEMQPVIVTDQPEEDGTIPSGAEGRYEISEQQIEDFSGPTGDFTQALEILPNVQFSDDRYAPGNIQGIRPSSVSISGGRVYENNFVIDGLRLNNRLDPLGGSPTSVKTMPSHEQSMFLDKSIIGEMNVYDSNVPASYGGFTGGVVDMSAKRAGQGEREIGWHYSTTRDDWVDYRVFHYTDPEDPTPSEPPEPGEFERQRMGLSLDQPLEGGRGLYTSVTRSFSSEPVVSLGKTRASTQENYSWHTRYSSPVGETGWSDLSLKLAPYESTNYIEDVRDSRFTLQGGGAALTGGLEWGAGESENELDVALSTNRTARDSPPHYFNWANTPSRSWGVDNDLPKSREGGFGDLVRKRSGLDASLDFQRPGLGGSEGSTGFRFGGELSWSAVQEEREGTSFIYKDAVVNSDIDCRGITLDCVDNEQYFSTRQIYPQDEVNVGLTEMALYGEADYRYGNVDTTYGLRYSHDSFLANHDLAPRFRGTWGLFGNEKTEINFGVNRYYGAALLAYKLREAREPYTTQYRGASQNVVNEWEPVSGQGSYRYDFSGADTPYSNEASLGVKQVIRGSRFQLKALAREGRDEFARKETDVQSDGYRYYRMTNEGESSYRSLSGSWFRTFGPLEAGINITWSESETTNPDYDDIASNPREDDYVYYRGERFRRAELERIRRNFARPLVGGINMAWQAASRTRVTLSSNYTGEHHYAEDSRRDREGDTQTRPDGTQYQPEYDVYEKRTRPATLISDLKLSHGFGDKPSLTIEVNVNNVFNARTYTAADDDPETRDEGIETGRSFWFGLSGKF